MRDFEGGIAGPRLESAEEKRLRLLKLKSLAKETKTEATPPPNQSARVLAAAAAHAGSHDEIIVGENASGREH
jgi:hypothetical protein